MADQNFVGITIDNNITFFTEDGVREIALRILKAINLSGKELSLLFCDRERMRGLNRDYRGKDRATDVLSFSQLEGELEGFDCSLLGDVVICYEVLLEQAAEQGVPIREELLRLLIHGILHLTGYDHESSNEEAEAMVGEENRVLTLLEDWIVG